MSTLYEEIKETEIVTTVSGKKLPRGNTKFIQEGYHEKGVDCFRVEGKWFRLNSGYIGYNIDEKCFFLLKTVDKYGFNTKVIIGLDSNNKHVYGFTKLRREFFYPIYKVDGQVIYALNEKIASSIAKFDDLRGVHILNSDTGTQIYVNALNPKNFPYSLKDYKLMSVLNEKIIRNPSLDYNSFHAVIAKIYHEKNEEPLNSKLGKQYNDSIGDITFGVESESANLGLAELNKISHSGLVCLRDGSVDGLELVSLPHRGFEGLMSTISQFSAAQKSFVVNVKCSVHIHVGGYELSDQQILGLYCLCYRIQNEIFEFVPPYKRNIEYLKSLAHEYSEPLKSLGIVYNKGLISEDGNLVAKNFADCFTKFCQFITLGRSNKLENCFQGEPKWKIESRYCWVNFTNFLTDRKGTLEFRCFPPTFDAFTIATWSILCKAIYKYGITKWKEILSDNFIVKVDDIWDVFLEGIEAESNQELIALVDCVRKIFNSIVDLNSSHAIVRQVTFPHYSKLIRQYDTIYNSLSTVLKNDLVTYKWREPELLKEITQVDFTEK
jgi:hypothetical protein